MGDARRKTIWVPMKALRNSDGITEVEYKRKDGVRCFGGTIDDADRLEQLGEAIRQHLKDCERLDNLPAVLQADIGERSALILREMSELEGGDDERS